MSTVLSTSVTLPSTLPTTAVSEHSDTGSGANLISTSALVSSGIMSSETNDAAVVQPAETLSRLFNIGGNPSTNPQPSTNAPSLSSTPSLKLSASTLTISDVQLTADSRKVAATPVSSSLANQVPSSTSVLLSTSSTAVTGQIISSSATPVPASSPAAASQAVSPIVVPIPISSGPVQVLGAGGDTEDEFAPVTLDPSSPAPTGTASYPTAADGNNAMASGFNAIYKSLGEDSACNPANPSQAYACVMGEIAECQSDETYVLKSCPRGQSCYALPKPPGLTGIVVQCAVPSVAFSILNGLPSSTVVAVTSQPAQMLQAEGDFSQATQSVSAQNLGNPTTSSPSAQATIQSQPIGPTPSVLAVTATAQEPHDSSFLNKAPEPNASPPAPSSTAAYISVPKAMFAVVTAPENDRALHGEHSAQTLASQPSAGILTPVVQSSAMSSQASPDALQLTEASVLSTPTSSADGAGVTFAPMGVPVNEKVAAGDGQATVTVTVTVTTTERTAPVTIIPS